MDHGRSPQAVAGRGTLWPLEAGARRFDVVGLGENSLDRLGRVARWPEPGGKQEWLDYSEMPGGQMASALVGCARLGLRVAYLGAVGSDAEAERVLEPLAQEGIDLSGVRRVQGARTRSATILVRTGDGERSVLAQPTLGLSLRTADLDRSAIEEASLLAVDLSDPDASLWAAGIARDAGIPVVLDADRVTEESGRLLGLVDFPAVSEDFAKAWAGVASAREGLEKLVSHGARLAVITCGERGAWAAQGRRRFSCAAFPVDVSDTTGAGDAFHAGLIWALFQRLPGALALRSACAVAGLSCRALGAQDGLPDEKALTEFLAMHPATEPGEEENDV